MSALDWLVPAASPLGMVSSAQLVADTLRSIARAAVAAGATRDEVESWILGQPEITRTVRDVLWFAVAGTDAIFCAPRTAAGIRWARARAERVTGPYDSADDALSAAHDALGMCRVCSRGQGRHVCAECQAAILPAALVASVAAGGAR